MSTVGQGQSQVGAAPAPFSALPAQIAASVAGTMIGEELGDTLPEKLIAGMLIAVIGAFLVAPGKHRRRRIVAVALLLALLDMLRRAVGALASTGRGRERERTAARPSQSWAPSSWAAVGLATVAGFGLGSLGTTAVDGWASDAEPVASIAIPDVRGETERAALQMLTDAGFEPVRAAEPSVAVEEGLAVRTWPPARARRAPESIVRLFVSTGPPPRDARIEIPPIKGLAKAAARRVLKDLGLRVTSENVPSADVSAGDATGTSPAAGERVAARARVTLLVSTGPPGRTVDVPPVENRSESQALRILRDAGLNPRPSRRESSADIPAGKATRTDPAAGRSVRKGSEVTLYLSSGRDDPEETVEVPDLVGTRANDARARLEALGLRAQPMPVPSSKPRGTVVAVDPGEGTRVPSGQVVALEVSDGSLVLVPDVVGMLTEDAQDELKRRGLASDPDIAPSSPEELGRVVRTEPAGDTEVERGSTVSLDVGCGDVSCID